MLKSIKKVLPGLQRALQSNTALCKHSFNLPDLAQALTQNQKKNKEPNNRAFFTPALDPQSVPETKETFHPLDLSVGPFMSSLTVEEIEKENTLEEPVQLNDCVDTNEDLHAAAHILLANGLQH